MYGYLWLIEMLTRLRRRLAGIFNSMATVLARTGVSPNTLTVLSLLFGFTAFISIYCFRSIPLYVLFAVMMGLMDALDGSLARLTGRTTRFGGFLDSTTDRINDVFLIYSLKFVGLSEELVIALIVVSFLISYTRARAEGLGLQMEGVGIIERAERIVGVVLVMVLTSVSILVSYIMLVGLLVLSIITVLQRILHVYYSTRDRDYIVSADRS